ncbi:MAG: hypothetical protein AAF662_02865 [Pseudomonadota bacterium]
MRYEFEIQTVAFAEYEGFLDLDRDTAYDLGNHYRVTEEIAKKGFPEGLRPVHIESNCDIYLFIGNQVLWFLAEYSDRLLFTHVALIGTEYEQVLALQETINRCKDYFEL